MNNEIEIFPPKKSRKIIVRAEISEEDYNYLRKMIDTNFTDTPSISAAVRKCIKYYIEHYGTAILWRNNPYIKKLPESVVNAILPIED